MTGRKLAWMGVLAIAWPAAAGAADRDATKLVAKSTDSATGAEVRVFTGDRQEMRLEVQDDRVFVSKTVRLTGIELKVTSGSDAITIALAGNAASGRVMSVTGTGGRVLVNAGAKEDLARAREVIARSPAVDRAVALLARLRIRPDSPLQPALLTTRAWLESAEGPSTAAGELAAWHRALRDRLVARRVSLEQDGPGECWQKYAKEAIEIAKDLDECMKDVSWYEIFDALACSTVYDVRAIGAFIWWLNCIGAMGLF